jgi:2-polyprenyl-3-methyl-5-hydroxy-6-metoxy-1,4-benzoquinol methylase
MSDQPFYDFPVDIANPSNAHGIQLRMLKDEGKRVLDVGCHSGLMGSMVKDQLKAEVVGVDFDPLALNVARARLDRVYEVDLEFGGWASELLEKGEGNFDVALFGDVLEHTTDPESILRETLKLLKPQGKVIVSLPNVANLRVRLGLLRGNFTYAESGILDRTHLRFFTLQSAHELLERSGYELEDSDVAGYSLPHWLIRMFPGLLAVQIVMRGRAR